MLEAESTLDPLITQRLCWEDSMSRLQKYYKAVRPSNHAIRSLSLYFIHWLLIFWQDEMIAFDAYNRNMIGEYPLIPREAFLFFPKDEEVYQIRNKKGYRIIFEGEVPYTPFEREKLQELHEELRAQGKNTHLAFLSQPTLLRFLQATKFDIQDCAKELKKYKKWQDSILPLRLRPQIEDILKKGLFYLTGRDINYRPVIVVNVGRIIQLDLEQKIFYEAVGYFFTWVIENCMVQGQVETWITIVDLGNIGMFSLGGTIIDIISFLSRNFRCRLHSSYLINCPSSIRFLFGMAKKAMTEDQINKIHLQEESQLPSKAFTNIFEQTIERKYGGRREDFTVFWPPTMEHQEPSSYQRTRLITVKQYGQMHFNGLLQKKKVSAALIEESHRLLREEEERQAACLKPSKIETEEEHQGNLITEASPYCQLELRDEDYEQDAPPRLKPIPKPIDFGDFFD